MNIKEKKKDTGVGSHSLLQGLFPIQVSHTAGRFFTLWANREALYKLKSVYMELLCKEVGVIMGEWQVVAIWVPILSSLTSSLLSMPLLLTHWQKPPGGERNHAQILLWCWYNDAGKDEGRRRRGDRGWDGWMASPTRWTWVWTSSRSRWWTGKPDVLQSLRLQRVRHGWVTELKWADNEFGFTRGYIPVQPGHAQPREIHLCHCAPSLSGQVDQTRVSGQTTTWPEFHISGWGAGEDLQIVRT